MISKITHLNSRKISTAFCILLSLIGLQALAQADTLQVQYDSIAVEIRAFDAQQLQEYLQDDTFVYEQKKITEDVSFLDFLLYWIRDWWNSLFEDVQNIQSFKMWMYILLGIVLTYIVLRFFDIDLVSFMYKSPSANRFKAQLVEEDIHEMDLEEEIKKAIAEGNFRLAVRYSYLRILKILSEKELISWRIEKTNHEYEVEIRDDALRQEFEQATYIFESICYGNFDVNREQFVTAHTEFETLSQKLNQVAAS
ncbi:DUF4129 domain-containing protein [Rapidithrix thailandica]|uniref:DUF4129 domain-containing protein n=1 Tax=Rapidithrix thailandica TaxID=413964 RepID=A0AAW9SA36_9BACT